MVYTIIPSIQYVVTNTRELYYKNIVLKLSVKLTAHVLGKPYELLHSFVCRTASCQSIYVRKVLRTAISIHGFLVFLCLRANTEMVPTFQVAAACPYRLKFIKLTSLHSFQWSPDYCPSKLQFSTSKGQLGMMGEMQHCLGVIGTS